MCFYPRDTLECRNMSSISEHEEVDESQTEERSEEDILTILVATDIHLGYAEKDPIRANDTFVTLEEILKVAQRENVDCILLGGDLFHDTRPSTHCLYKCTELLKRYCLGDRPVQIEFLSDPSHNFSYSNDTVNYEDPNLNVAFPVFSIHGNHDDPTGEQQISALNLLASMGLVNYFGKYNSHTSVDIEPLLLKKGESKIALYGLSHIKDERLARLFLDKNVTFMAPQDQDDWFHLLVLHQNRANRGAKTFIPDDSLPDLLDLVIWGHEHDCRITPEATSNNVYISQPGSSVATSLCYGESRPKNIGLLKIHKKQFNMIPIPLKTVRPMIYKDLLLKNIDEMQEELDFVDETLTHQELAEKIVEKQIDIMIAEANDLGQEGNLLPLIRLNVTYVDEKQTFNAIRFGQKYIDRVANPKEMVKLKSGTNKVINRKPKGMGPDDEFLANENMVLPSRVEDLVLQLFESGDHKQLSCLSLKALNDSVVKCIDSSDLDAPIFVANHLIKDLRLKLEADMVEIDQVEQFLDNIRNQEDEPSLVEKILKNRVGTGKNRHTNDDDDDDDDDMRIAIDSDDDGSPARANTSTASRGGSSRPARGPGSRGGRVSRGGRGRAKAK